ATAARPLVTSTVATPGTSVMVTVENSRTVTTARPPSRIRANDSLPVVIRSRTSTGSRNRRSVGSGDEARATATRPSTEVTYPACSWAAATETRANVATTGIARIERPRYARRMAEPPKAPSGTVRVGRSADVQGARRGPPVLVNLPLPHDRDLAP